jgi:hypothetical protein
VDTWVVIATIAAVIGAVASVIAAGGVIWERWHWDDNATLDRRACRSSQQRDFDLLGKSPVTDTDLPG